MESFWDGRAVFITGATGFVGAHIARLLLDKGAKVICLQRDEVRSNSLDILNLRDKVVVVRGAIGDLALMQRILNEYRIDAVFHLAAQPLVGAANRSPLSTFETNIRGSYLLLEACRLSETVKRIVVASSDKAYGSHDSLPYREDFPLLAVYPYDVSKTCTDLLASSYAYSYGLPVTVCRSANIYGGGDMNLSRIIPGTIITALKNENPIIRSDGTPVREFIHVSDVARGYLLLAERIEETKGEAFNFGTNEPVQMLQLVNLILRTMGKTKLQPEILLKDKIARKIDAQYLSGEKINKMFGWKCEIELEAGLRETINWYRENFERVV